MRSTRESNRSLGTTLMVLSPCMCIGCFFLNFGYNGSTAGWLDKLVLALGFLVPPAMFLVGLILYSLNRPE